MADFCRISDRNPVELVSSFRWPLRVVTFSRSCDPYGVHNECSKSEVVNPYEGSVSEHKKI